MFFSVVLLMRVNEMAKENIALLNKADTSNETVKENSLEKAEEDTMIIELPKYEIEAPLFDPKVNIMERIDNYLSEYKANVGFVYYNFQSGEKISFNENKTFEAASTYKVGLNLVCYDLVQNGEISLDDQVYYNPSQFQEGSGILQNEENLTSLPLQTVLDYSIIYSDNIAATMAFDYIGGWSSFRTMLGNLVDIENIDYKNITTPENEFKILKYLYDNRENQYYNYLLETMKQTIFHDRLDKYLPADKVAHKVGDMDFAAHDIGIVFSEEPYIIIILTEGVYGSYDVIADLSKAMYLYNSHKISVKEIAK